MANAVVAAELLDFFRKHPRLHNQFDWAQSPDMEYEESTKLAQLLKDDEDLQKWLKSDGCGTTRCVAGQAVIQERPDLLDFETNHYGIILNLRGEKDWDVLGMEILELDRRDAHQLFFITNDRQALMALEYLSRGEDIDWKAVYDDPEWEFPTVQWSTYSDWSDWSKSNDLTDEK